jgi:hypothetical protein
VRRPGALAWVSVGLVLVAGCAGRPDVPDKATRVDAQQAMIRQVDALPGAKITASVSSSLDGGQNNVGVTVRLAAAASTADIKSLGDSIERTIWLSHLDPLGRISINFTRVGSSVSVAQRLYQDSIDTKALRDKYGPRPDGLEPK